MMPCEKDMLLMALEMGEGGLSCETLCPLQAGGGPHLTVRRTQGPLSYICKGLSSSNDWDEQKGAQSAYKLV